ncbi:betaine-aldehyde dehydrogenase [Amycolatopsis lurida]|uniref:aldehyde dehydrogenase family protein n=1 Tax=Amycolatopsis lurida TaxID=31959 RepID=UPI0005AD31FC|nr:aldehyde dehydrogenase family protein [Amycolatopsis lurida]SEC39721.1 betaine-aldehyde dehydrogenase [Amycolatopsis lurida]
MRYVDVAGVRVPGPGSVFVGGDWVTATGLTRRVVSPSTGEIVLEVVLPGESEARLALESADGPGRDTWARSSVAERVEVCRRFCAAIEERIPELGVVWAVEAGMPVAYSAILHKFGAAGGWRSALDSAEAALREDVRHSPLGDVLVRREPAGVVVAIMAYNGPLVTLATKVIPALLAGCPVIVKAAPESQLIMRLVAECAIAAHFPTGALSILCGEIDVAERLTADPRVDLVSLTGGQVAAQRILDATRDRFARTHFELGGKSPALILDDAPLERVLKSLVPGATGGAGQVCALLSRILVSEQRHDEVVDALRIVWQNLKIGEPLDPATRVGPLVNDAALKRTEGFIERAKANGARVVAGGHRPPGLEAGFFHEPTLLTEVARGTELAREEVFGPVTAVLTYRDFDDALALANDTGFGLAATVYTTDRDAAMAAAARITTGSVAINTFGPTVTAPFGGRKGSGWGRESGPEGIHEFTELKQVLFGPGL